MKQVMYWNILLLHMHQGVKAQFDAHISSWKAKLGLKSAFSVQF